VLVVCYAPVDKEFEHPSEYQSQIISVLNLTLSLTLSLNPNSNLFLTLPFAFFH